jgi:hypothetical protein
MNPNTVVRAYRELEIRGILRARFPFPLGDESARALVARAGNEGFTFKEIRDRLNAARRS